MNLIENLLVTFEYLGQKNRDSDNSDEIFKME